MVEFEEFVDTAIQMGKGRSFARNRQLPTFVPEGNYQDVLCTKSILYLKENGFNLIDLQNESYENAIDSFNLNWPSVAGKYPSEEFEQLLETNEKKLLIACGQADHSRFWKWLAEDSILYTGSGFPPIKKLSLSCIVVPDSACVVILIKDSDYREYNVQYFGPVGRYNSNTVPFQI